MKITCQSCAAKYTIADEKVAGKTVKIKCKKCGATIVVNGAEVGYQAAPAADPSYMQQQAPPGGGGEEEEGDGQTAVFGADHATSGAPPAGDWTVNVADDDQRTMSSDQIAAAYAAGTVTNDTYVWRDGMADWSPLSGVPELMALVSRAAPAPAPAPRPLAAAAPAGAALGGTMMMADAAPAAAPAPAAARRSANRAEKADPFQASQQAAAAAAPPPAKTDRAVGERNENSMLFSISALTAAKEARDTKAPAKNGGRGGVDDILNLGGGAAPILAPPPLLAPVVEAPPMAAPIAPVVPTMPGMGMGPVPGAQMQMGGPTAMGMDDTYPRKKSPVGLIVGIVAGLAVVGGVAFFLMGRGDQGATPTTPDQTSVSATPTNTAAPTTPTTAAAADTGAAATPTTPTTAAATDTAAGQQPRPGVPGPTGPIGPGPTTAKTGTTAAPTAEPPPVKTAEPVATAAPSPDGAEFNRGAATSALGAAAGAAKSCKKPDGPTGSGRVKVTFAPSGNVTSAQVEGPPFAGTPVGGCIASAFRSAKVPPFSGPPVSVSKSFNIN
jgi:predicted Zn finger-like uncharacterized protein